MLCGIFGDRCSGIQVRYGEGHCSVCLKDTHRMYKTVECGLIHSVEDGSLFKTERNACHVMFCVTKFSLPLLATLVLSEPSS